MQSLANTTIIKLCEGKSRGIYTILCLIVRRREKSRNSSCVFDVIKARWHEYITQILHTDLHCQFSSWLFRYNWPYARQEGIYGTGWLSGSRIGRFTTRETAGWVGHTARQEGFEREISCSEGNRNTFSLVSTVMSLIYKDPFSSVHADSGFQLVF